MGIVPGKRQREYISVAMPRNIQTMVQKYGIMLIKNKSHGFIDSFTMVPVSTQKFTNLGVGYTDILHISSFLVYHRVSYSVILKENVMQL